MSIPVEAVAEYQCPGCMYGPAAPECSKYTPTSLGCSSHAPGTMELGYGALALGLPKGFCRFGHAPTTSIDVYESYDAMLTMHPNLGSVFSVAVWKHLDQNGNTIARYFSPRTNHGWSIVVLGDCRDCMPHAIEITAEQIAEMN